MQMLSVSEFWGGFACTYTSSKTERKGRKLDILNTVWNKTDGPYFAHTGFQWSGEAEEEVQEEDYLIDKSLMIKWGCVWACLLSCLCLQMAFDNLREIQLLLMLAAC